MIKLQQETLDATKSAEAAMIKLQKEMLVATKSTKSISFYCTAIASLLVVIWLNLFRLMGKL
jgi:hypothetical protein